MNAHLNGVQVLAAADSVDNVSSFLGAHSLSLLGVVVGIAVVAAGLIGKNKKAMIVAGVSLLGFIMIIDPSFLPTAVTTIAKKAVNG